MSSTSRLVVEVDGVPLPDTQAIDIWTRFSEHMDATRGDLASFAKTEGWSSVHPGARPGVAVLVASRTAPQRPYGNAAALGGDADGPGVRPPRQPRAARPRRPTSAPRPERP